jgi:hypothetical protein
LLSWLQDDNYFPNNLDIWNYLKFNIPIVQPNYQWLLVSITTINQKKYIGSLNFYAYIFCSEGNLEDDFINRWIDLSSVSSAAITIDQFNSALANLNTNLKVDKIKFQYNSTPLLPTNLWTDWIWDDGKFGIGLIDTNESSSLPLWDKTNDCFANIKIAPSNDDYYRGCEPLLFKLKLYRPQIKNVSGWKSNPVWSPAFYSTPIKESFRTRFDSLYFDKDWFINKLDNDYSDTYEFININADSACFSIFGNPYYMSVSTGSDYLFSWSYSDKISVSTLLYNEQSIVITALTFIDTPNISDVIYLLNHMIKTTIVDTISWNQIFITIMAINDTSGMINLCGINDSIKYLTNDVSLDYTIVS